MGQFKILEAIKQCFVILMLTFVLTSCLKEGEAVQCLTGDEQNLPSELKGLKVYNVGIGSGEYVRVAIINGQAVATGYREYKQDKYVAIINNESTQTHREIYAKGVISENDSIIVLRK